MITLPPAPDGLAEAGRLAIASLVGLAVGIEREWSGHASGPTGRFAGVRTFFLVGLAGGAAGLLLGWTSPLAASALLLGVSLFIAAAYTAAVRRPGMDLDGTTEAAALVVLALGTFAGLGKLGLASGAAAIVVLALREKDEVHALVHRIGEREMLAALQFAVLATVVLPLLPEGPYGPLGGIRPRTLWEIVLVLSGLNFAGYLARRAVGARRGFAVAGALGGIVSSTAVTLQFSRASKKEPGTADALATGAIAASLVLIPRVIVLSAALSPALGLAVAPLLLPALAAGAAVLAVLHRRTVSETFPPADTRSPLGLGTALVMALVFQAASMLMVAVQAAWGRAGVIGSAAAMGATDMDAVTISMARLAEQPAAIESAALGLAAGVLANTLVKLGISVVFGAPTFRRVTAIGLVGMGAAIGVAVWLR